jgi:hypothetical protein
MAQVEKEFDHQVSDGSENITLKISVGDNQSISAVRVKGPGGYLSSSNGEYDLGSGAGAKGNTTLITATVADDNSSTNMTSLTIELSNGSANKTFSDDQAGTADMYSIDINHI